MMAEKKTPRTNKKPVAEKAKAVEPEAAVENRSRWGFGSIIWGLVLITIGVLALLNNFGVVALDLVGLMQLWPLLFIIWGVSVLSFRNIWWRLATIVLAVLVMVFAVWVAIGGMKLDSNPAVQRQVETVRQADTTVDLVDVNVEAGAGKVTINSADMKDELRAELNSNVATLKQVSSRSGSEQRVDLKLESNNRWWIAGVRNELALTMGRRLPIDMSLKFGAADLSADLSEVKLNHLKLDVGAASANVRLGALLANTTVQLKAGASSITLNIPKDSGVKVTLDGGVSSKNFEDLDKKSDGVYESSNYQAAAHKVVITGDLGATSFTIDRY